MICEKNGMRYSFWVDDNVCCVCVRQINNDGAAIDCSTFSHCVMIIQQFFSRRLVVVVLLCVFTTFLSFFLPQRNKTEVSLFLWQQRKILEDPV